MPPNMLIMLVPVEKSLKVRAGREEEASDILNIDGRNMSSNNHPKAAAAVRVVYADYSLIPAG